MVLWNDKICILDQNKEKKHKHNKNQKYTYIPCLTWELYSGSQATCNDVLTFPPLRQDKEPFKRFLK